MGTIKINGAHRVEKPQKKCICIYMREITFEYLKKLKPKKCEQNWRQLQWHFSYQKCICI